MPYGKYLAQLTRLALQLGASTQRQRARDSWRSRDRQVCIGGSFLCDILTTSDSTISAAIAIDAREGLLSWQSAGWRIEALLDNLKLRPAARWRSENRCQAAPALSEVCSFDVAERDRRTVKVEPAPSRLSTSMLPP